MVCSKPWPSRRPVAVLALALAVLTGCGRGSEADNDFGARAAQRAAQFQDALKAELTHAMAAGGPVEAIRVCSEKAPWIAAQLSDDGCRVRRIGTRVRNVANTPDKVDAEALAALAQPGAAPLTRAGTDGIARHYVPLRIAPLCLACHGKVEDLAVPVREQLTKIYPADQAVGYALDELRGAVVVESAAR